METHFKPTWRAVTLSERSAEELTHHPLSAGEGVYITAGLRAERFEALNALMSHPSEPNVALPVGLKLSELLPLAHHKLTLDGPHPSLPGVAFKALRLQLSLPSSPSLSADLLGLPLYLALSHLPSSTPQRAVWCEHTDGALDVTLEGADWSLRLSAERNARPLPQLEEESAEGGVTISGTELGTGERISAHMLLNHASGPERLTPWSTAHRARWARALSLLSRAQTTGVATLPPEAEVHPSAQLHPTVELSGAVKVGANTKVWHFSKLLGPLELGPQCNLGQNVVVERGAHLGRNVKVQNNVSIYAGVVLEDDVFCGPSMVFTNVGTPRSHYPRRGAYQETRVKRGASIGANATVVCGHTIGRYALVGAGAVVTRDVPDHALVYGNPARVRGWVCYCGEGLGLGQGAEAQVGEAHAECPECGRRYQRSAAQVKELTEG